MFCCLIQRRTGCVIANAFANVCLGRHPACAAHSPSRTSSRAPPGMGRAGAAPRLSPCLPWDHGHPQDQPRSRARHLSAAGTPCTRTGERGSSRWPSIRTRKIEDSVHPSAARARGLGVRVRPSCQTVRRSTPKRLSRPPESGTAFAACFHSLTPPSVAAGARPCPRAGRWYKCL